MLIPMANETKESDTNELYRNYKYAEVDFIPKISLAALK